MAAIRATSRQLDLLVGTLAEGHRPTGFGFGETMFQIFILNATRRLQADRFYTDCYNEDVYTPEGLQLDRRDRLQDRDSAPLSGARATPASPTSRTPSSRGTKGQMLDPERHPLRAMRRRIEGRPLARRRLPPCVSVLGSAEC